MPLTLVLGPANSAKAGEVLGAYGDAARRGALLVVPTAADAEHYARELAERGCVLRAVVTFGGLVDEIARRTGYAARRVSELARERLLRRALAGQRLTALEGAWRSPGFAPAALAFITELERALLTPERFAAALRAWAREDPRRAAYAQDLGAIYAAYAAELGRADRVDAELFAWRALDSLRARPGRWGADAVFFYGFDDLHGLQRDAVETLSRVVGAEVTVSLTYERDRPALNARAELVAELRALAGRVLELAPRADYYEPASRSVLHHLERSLFQPGAGGRPEPGDAVRLLEAAGELAEAELVAAEARSLLDAGMAPEELVVVLRRPAPTMVEALTRAFERYGVPIWARRSVPFAHTALGRGLLALARCSLAGGGAQDLLDYLRTPGRLRDPDVVDRLEARARREPLRTLEEARKALGFDLGEIDALRAAPDPAAELIRQGARLLAAPFRGRAPRLDGAAELDAHALGALARCAAELAELDEAPRGSELVELLRELEIPPRPAPRGAVTVTDPLAIRARRFRAVFVCRLQEGAFPLAAPPEPFLSDERRRELAAATGLRLPAREDVLDRERYLFYACVSRATERVVLSYQSSDEEGNIALPSPFLDDVAEVLHPGWRERRRRRRLADVVWAAQEAPTERERRRALAAAPGPGAPEGDGQQRWRLTRDALRHVRHTEILSAGALECYAECPMKWLVERELRPLALEPPPEALQRGSYMHDVLERVLARLGAPITPETLPEAIELLHEAMAELPPDLAPGLAEALRRGVALAIAADLRRYLEYEAGCAGGWPAAALELRFGFGAEEEDAAAERAPLPPLVLGEGEGAVALRGAIDRVDVEPGGRRAAVRDYKSGPARSEHQGGRWRAERRLQVALYMLAVRELLGLDPVAGLYQPLGGKDLRPRGIHLIEAPVQAGLLPGDGRDREALEAELAAARERALALAASLRSGRLAPTPSSCSRQGCRYPGICRAP